MILLHFSRSLPLTMPNKLDVRTEEKKIHINIIKTQQNFKVITTTYKNNCKSILFYHNGSSRRTQQSISHIDSPHSLTHSRQSEQSGANPIKKIP